MKDLIIVLICGFLLQPLSVWGRKWIEPYMDKDGNWVEGHWQTPEDVRKGSKDRTGGNLPYGYGVQKLGGGKPMPMRDQVGQQKSQEHVPAPKNYGADLQEEQKERQQTEGYFPRRL